MSKPKHNILGKFLTRIGLLKYGYSVNKGFPLEIREGSDRSIWILVSFFLLKLSLKPRLIFKRNYKNYTPNSVSKIFNRINPRCWEIIEHSIKQKNYKKNKNLQFPKIEINNYKIPYRYFEILIFYKSKNRIIAKFNRSNFGGFGHLNMEIFPILIYLSSKLPLILSIQGLESQENIFNSFAEAYKIKTTTSVEKLNGTELDINLVISKYGLKVDNPDEKYEYPNYNNICLMLNKINITSDKSNFYSKYIYVGRKKNTSYGRRLINENKLIDKLTPLGFKVIYPEEYSFKEQISIFSNAKVVAGVSGSALLNGIFSNENSHIVELCPDQDFRPGVWLSTVFSKSKYHLILGTSYNEKLLDLKPDKFVIDVSIVMKKIKEILN